MVLSGSRIILSGGCSQSLLTNVVTTLSARASHLYVATYINPVGKFLQCVYVYYMYIHAQLGRCVYLLEHPP